MHVSLQRLWNQCTACFSLSPLHLFRLFHLILPACPLQFLPLWCGMFVIICLLALAAFVYLFHLRLIPESNSRQNNPYAGYNQNYNYLGHSWRIKYAPVTQESVDCVLLFFSTPSLSAIPLDSASLSPIIFTPLVPNVCANSSSCSGCIPSLALIKVNS